MTQAPLGAAHVVADDRFAKHGEVFGSNLPTYRGHVHRVIGLTALQVPITPEVAGSVGVAAFFHDAGIWFDQTWDYLPPSASRAVDELGGPGTEHAELVEAMIVEHHRLRKARHSETIVEAFRRADLTDVSAGLIGRPGTKRRDYRALTKEYPARGFRPMLFKAAGRGIRESPLHPIPMIKF